MEQIVPVDLGPRSYAIHIGAGLLSRIGEWCAALSEPGAALVVTDEHVAPIALEPCLAALRSAGLRAEAEVLPPGEATKSAEPLFRLYRRALAAGLDRRGIFIALGGGVIGDLAGFAAATYLRGVRLVQVPTTLLAMVDSAIGGKTAVNMPEGKNLIGTFHQPRLVWCDLSLLGTLPLREVRSGFGEIVKYAILEPAVFRMLNHATPKTLLTVPFPETVFTRRLVLACAACKLRIVARDEREQTGLRECLNLGHTVAHAIETAAGYGTYTHGEAVALGLVAEIHLARRMRVCAARDADRALGLITRFLPPDGFPRLPEIPPSRLIALMRRDKKTRHGRLRCALPVRVGVVRTFDDVPTTLVQQALGDLHSWMRGG